MKANINTIRDLVSTAITADDTFNAAIGKLREIFAGQTEVQVRATLLPVVGSHYKLTVGVAKSGPTAGQAAFVLGDKPTEELKRRRNTAQQKLGRLVGAICNEDCSTPAEKAAAKMASLMRQLGKLTPKQKRSIVNALAGELGLTVK